MTKDDQEIYLNIQDAIMIKEAKSNKELIKLAEEAKEQGLRVSEFTREMIETSNDRKIVKITKDKQLDEVEFLGVLIFGQASAVDKLTKQFKLSR